uniref:Cyclic GMP-AMP synthase n=1 Tax=Electrophorus electricus TaxID=8005 RepID=A0A4W4F2I7_ELEEL
MIRQRGRDLRLRQIERKPAVMLVNNLIKDLLKFLKENEGHSFFRDVSVFTSGSYYELVKINKPNEFDIMLKLKTPQLTWMALEDYNGLFYRVSLCRSTRSEIRSFLLEDERTISSSKVIKEMQRLVHKFMNTHQGLNRVNSPAVTLAFKKHKDDDIELSVDIVPALEVSQGWPEAARSGLDIDKWLGKKARRKFVSRPVYFVPKRPKWRKLSDHEKESWRISFSHIEKEMIMFHGNKKTCCETKPNECCRKLCLRLLKCLFEGLKNTYPKELEPLCSYHGKTAFFHNLSQRFEDSLWTPGQLSHCFMRLLVDFEHAAQIGSLPHFFIPQFNLFSPASFPKRSLLFLANSLREQRELGLPLLRAPSPTPALCCTPPLQLQSEEISQQQVTLRKNDTKAFVICIMIFTCLCINLATIFTESDLLRLYVNIYVYFLTNFQIN